LLSFSHPHHEVVTPWQEHNAGDVFLYVRQVKVQKAVPTQEKHAQRRNIFGAKQTEHVDSDQDR
jgi:hypothetical protein